MSLNLKSTNLNSFKVSQYFTSPCAVKWSQVTKDINVFLTKAWFLRATQEQAQELLTALISPLKQPIFNLVSNEIWDCFVDVPRDWSKKNLRHSFYQSDAKLKPITNWWPAFSRALVGLIGFILISHWLIKLVSYLLIGFCDYFAFGLTTI